MRRFITSRTLVLALLLSIWQSMLALPPVLRAEDDNRQSAPSSQSALAKSLFTERCVRCHGTDGRGQTKLGEMLDAPDFTDETWWDDEKNEKRFVRSITEGKHEMPAFGKKLSKREISALAIYIRSFRKSER